MANHRINKIANQISVVGATTIEGACLFEELYSLCKPYFKKFYSKYVNFKNLRRNSFDVADYESAFGVALYDAVKEYDINKGDFLSRVYTFSLNRFKAITAYNFASKRYSNQLSSLPEVPETFVDRDNKIEEVENTTNEVISSFIAEDKHGEVIKIYLTYATRADRNKALTTYFGQYGERERKIVERTKKRLSTILKEEELCQ